MANWLSSLYAGGLAIIANSIMISVFINFMIVITLPGDSKVNQCPLLLER